MYLSYLLLASLAGIPRAQYIRLILVASIHSLIDSKARKSADSLASTYFCSRSRSAAPAIIRRGPGREYRPPLVAGNRIEAGVRGHAAEPRAPRRTFLQAVAIPPGAKQGFLHRVLGVRQRAEHAVTVEQQLAAMTLDVASELVHYVPPFQRCRWISIDSYL